MSHEQVLLSRVATLRTRIRLLVSQRWACLGVTAAALIGLFFVLATRLQWWLDAVDYLWLLLLTGLLAGGIYGLTRPISPMAAAQIADERAELDERLSTALEVLHTGNSSPLAAAQIADAVRHAQSLQPSRVLPWRPPPHWRHMVGALGMLAAAMIVPDLGFLQSPQERIDRAVMREEGKRIQRVAKEMEKKAAQQKKDEANDEIARRIAREMQRLGRNQELGRISKKQAMLKMNELQKLLKESQEKAGAGQNAERNMEQVASQLREAAQRQGQNGNQEAAKQLASMADNLQKRDFQAAQKQLEEMAKKLQNGKLSPEEAGKAAELLREMAAGLEKSELAQASDQLKQAAEQLKQAAANAEKLQRQLAEAKTPAERQQIQQQMSQAMAQAGQQAGEQCEKAGGT